MSKLVDTNKLKFSVFQDERFVDLNLYQFGWERCEPLHSFGPHIRNHYLFHYIISGKGILHSNGNQYQLQAGMGFLIVPNEVTTYLADEHDPWEYAWIEFDGLSVPGCLNQAGLHAKQPIYKPVTKEAGHLLHNQMMTIIDQNNASSMHLIGQGFIFLDLLVRGGGYKETNSGKRLRDFYMKEALAFIEQHYHLDISIENIADFCGLDRSYFGRIFRDTMGASPQRFLMIYRMAKAEQLLKETNQPIGKISSMVGYTNQLHFSRAFKDIYGISPREYRQKHFNSPHIP